MYVRPAVYNEPGLNFDGFIDESSFYAQHLIPLQDELLILGDFNTHVVSAAGALWL